MDGAFDIPDSTDWLKTPLKDLAPFENALHCEICKEFYDTPMITSCSHTFCSKCIRTALSTEGRCPSCRAQDQASKLRNNYVLQEIVARFQVARPAALEVAKRDRERADAASAPNGRVEKRKRTALDAEERVQSQEDRRTTRSKSRRIAASQTSEPETIEVVDSEAGSDFEPEKEPDDGLVECPLGCGKRMKIEAVDPHLDRCEDEQKQASRAKSRTPVNMFNSTRPPSAQNAPRPERISELNYSLLNDTKLRAKLRELNIPNWGPKQLMIKRHTEWVNLWNANCDSKNPRSERELLRELDQWERTQGGRAPNPTGLASTVMRKDFDGTAWTNKNRDDFSRLIAEAKRRKNSPAIEAGTPKGLDGAEEEVTSAVNGVAADDVSHDLPTGDVDQAKPLENNPEAIASIRQKVDAANAGQSVELAMNAGFKPPEEDDEPHVHSPNLPKPAPGPENPALLEQSHFGLSNGVHAEKSSSQSASHDIPLGPSPVKKVPMFAVPQQPFSDVDGAGEGAAEH